MFGEPMRHEQTNDGAAKVHEPGILIADDMALIPTLLKFELESRGFAVWLAVDGDDAVDLYRRHREEICLVLLNVQMSGLDGPHTLEALQRLNPDVVACFMSESEDIYTQQELMDRGAAWIFSKPIHPAGVAEVLQQVVTAPDRARSSGDWQTQ
jgi:two-component system, cell cycle sensor histidine kinase and response regulator CckA